MNELVIVSMIGVRNRIAKLAATMVASAILLISNIFFFDAGLRRFPLFSADRTDVFSMLIPPHPFRTGLPRGRGFR